MQRSKLLAELALLFAGFQSGKPVDELTAEAYCASLSTIPDQYVLEAIDRFKRGVVEGMSLHVPPSAPAIVLEAQRLMPRAKPIYLAAPEKPISDAERARNQHVLPELAARLAAPSLKAQEERINRRRMIMRETNARLLARDPDVEVTEEGYTIGSALAAKLRAYAH